MITKAGQYTYIVICDHADMCGNQWCCHAQLHLFEKDAFCHRDSCYYLKGAKRNCRPFFEVAAEARNPYKVGSQPCKSFTPRSKEVGVLSRYRCPRCGKLRVFCTWCDFDHHEGGWETCRSDEEDAPVAGEMVDGGDYDIVEPEAAGEGK